MKFIYIAIDAEYDSYTDNTYWAYMLYWAVGLKRIKTGNIVSKDRKNNVPHGLCLALYKALGSLKEECIVKVLLDVKGKDIKSFSDFYGICDTVSDQLVISLLSRLEEHHVSDFSKSRDHFYTDIFLPTRNRLKDEITKKQKRLKLERFGKKTL